MCYNRSGCLKVQSLWQGWRKNWMPLLGFLDLCRDDSSRFSNFGQLGTLPLIHLQALRIANPAKHIADFRAFPHLCSAPLTPDPWTSQYSCYSHLCLNSKGKPIAFQSPLSLSIYIYIYIYQVTHWYLIPALWKATLGTFPVVYWLRLHALDAEGMGSVPG